ncbi:VOC family protein [Rhodoplanes sp. TEM]|uniref:VOC family protein n=1 Tax=Rhodoplanes tepidamans TaxID=200616 RepID=A0ABT5JIF8_RHOTP|nr:MULTISPECIES: VOC family protein [Rhodoplanes]MDC7789489.1 VOC family protein [Rhodoplanes tepidamans]MDC7986119.1 VOC family protein [Rhodoplanes sp. TEM]MDQ0358906.1 catechol 2,3-dioxygenase-like lactoylglutathione lyase family enzyme [Rhodoplanes tepidamans]
MPSARLTVITLGVSDMRASIAFYTALGFARHMPETGEAVAFFATGGSVLALYPWEALADDAGVSVTPRPAGFRGTTLAWNCNTREEVDAALSHALACGGTRVKPAVETHYGGWSGYFADPDGHLWEVVTAPGLAVSADGRVVFAG